MITKSFEFGKNAFSYPCTFILASGYKAFAIRPDKLSISNPLILEFSDIDLGIIPIMLPIPIAGSLILPPLNPSFSVIPHKLSTTSDGV